MPQDAELIAGMIRGEPEAFAELYQKYRARLHQYALSLIRSRMEAEDVVQDVFVGLAKQAGGGRMPRELSAYLYVSVRNRCVDRMRRKPELPLDDLDLDLLVAPAGDEERIDDDRIERLLKGYRLPEVSRDLDHRVVREGAAILARARFRATVQDVGRTLLHQLGFGYIPWLFDLVTTTDAEYRVDLI